MPVTRLLVGVALVVAFLAVPAGAAGPLPAQPPESSKPISGADVEVKCVDNSVLNLKVIDEKLELVTRHGVLQIAVADIRRIEFATRIPTAVAEKVAVAISKLDHADFKVREAATEELKGYRARAYPQLLKAQKSEDPEVMRRAQEIVAFIKNKVPAAELELREFDVVETNDSKNAGRLTAETMRVNTLQFGEQRLKLVDVRTLRGGTGAEAEVVNAVPAPASLVTYQNQVGKEYAFSVTGSAQGGVYGTDVYTLDSSLATAVVHAGLAKAGETVTVTVRILASPPQFNASTRNGISSNAYGPYPAFEFVRK